MERSVRAILRAETAGFESDMRRAAQATEQVGTAAQGAARQTQRSTEQQTTAARSFSQRLLASAQENEQAWRTLGTTFGVVGGAMTGLLGVVANTGIQYNALRQQATQGLTAVTGSAEEAAAQMRRLDEYGQNSWLMRDSLIRAQRDMTGFGIETSRVIPYMDALAEGVAAAGGSNQDFEELAQIVGRVNSQGKLTAETFNEFGNRGIDAAQMIGDAMGMTAGQIREQVTAGTLDAQDALDALAEGLVMNFEGSSDLVRQTFRGAVDDVSAAIRDISAISFSWLVDPEGGGVLTGLLNSVSDVLFALRDLPDPILQVGGALAGLGALATTAAGGFLFLLPQLQNIWRALGDIGGQGIVRTAGRRILTVGRHAATAAIGVVAIGSAVQALQGHFRDAALGADELSLAMGRFDFDAPFAHLSDSYGDLSEAFERLTGQGMIDRLDRFLSATNQAMGGFLPDDLAPAREEFGRMGQELANLVESGNMQAANDQFNQMVMQLGGTAQAAEEALELMPAYRAQLERVAEAQGLSADTATILGLAAGTIATGVWTATDASDAYTGTIERLAEKQAQAVESLQAWHEMVSTATGTFGGLADAYNDVAAANEDGIVSMEAWIDKLREQNEAIENWQDNALTATAQIREEMPRDMHAAADAVIDELLNMGAEGAAALQEFVKATPEQRAELVDEWMRNGLLSGDAFADGLEAARRPEVDLETAPAEQALEALLGAIANSEENVTINGTSVPAENVLAEVQAAILATDEPVTINGHEVPALDVLSGVMTAIENSEEYVTINGDRIPADAVVGQLLYWVAQQGADVNVGANMFNAESAVQAFKNRYDGETIAESYVNVYTRLIDQGVSRGMAASGARYTARARAHYDFAHGGYTGDGGKYEPAGIVHKGEWVTTKEHTADPFNRSLLEAMHAGQDLRAALTGYANGGPVGGGRSIMPVMTPPQPAVVGGAQQFIVNNYAIPADQVGRFASETLFAIRLGARGSLPERSAAYA